MASEPPEPDRLDSTKLLDENPSGSAVHVDLGSE